MNSLPLAEIDEALAEPDVKKAEIIIAKCLRQPQLPVYERAALLFRRAQARLLDARADDALEDLETSLSLNPAQTDQAQTLTLLGDIYFAKFELAPVGFLDRDHAVIALQYYESARQKEAGNQGWISYQLGRIFLSQHEIQKAMTAFQGVFQHPNQPPYLYALAYERLGFIDLFENRQPEQALTHFQNAKQHSPKTMNPVWSVQLYIRMSRAYLDLHQYEEALKNARRALRETQNGTTSSHRAALPDAYLATAEVMATLTGYEAEAIEYYLRFLQTSKRPQGIDVTWSHIHETIGHLSLRLEQFQQAITAFEKALEFNPYHPWETNLRYQIARCHYAGRQFERCIGVLEGNLQKADRENTPIQDWKVYNLLGNAYFALEKYPKAASAYRKAAELAPSGTRGLETTRIYLRFSEELSQVST